MKNSAKSLIGFSIFVFFTSTLLILAIVGLKLECEKLTKEKVITEEKFSDIKNSRINLTAQDQALSSEERIVSIAQNELGMVRRTEAPIELTVSKEEIEKVSNAINKKYE
jgi:cell division protein FtsB